MKIIPYTELQTGDLVMWLANGIHDTNWYGIVLRVWSDCSITIKWIVGPGSKRPEMVWEYRDLTFQKIS